MGKFIGGLICGAVAVVVVKCVKEKVEIEKSTDADGTFRFKATFNSKK